MSAVVLAALVLAVSVAGAGAITVLLNLNRHAWSAVAALLLGAAWLAVTLIVDGGGR